MAKVFFYCEECKALVQAKNMIIDAKNKVTLTDKEDHSVTYIGLRRSAP